MDDTIDEMHQTAKATLLYEVREFGAPMRRMGDIIIQAAELTQSAIPLFAVHAPEREQAEFLQRRNFGLWCKPSESMKRTLGNIVRLKRRELHSRLPAPYCL